MSLVKPQSTQLGIPLLRVPGHHVDSACIVEVDGFHACWHGAVLATRWHFRSSGVSSLHPGKVGGLALILSIYARQVSLGLTLVLMAAASVPFGKGWVQTGPNDGWKYSIFLVAAAALYLMGHGASAIRQGDCFALRL